jgi:Transposase DDE domain group 1
MSDDCSPHLTFWNLGSQQLLVDFDGGRIVADAGLLGIRALEKPLGFLADLAQRLPDPRSPKYIQHSAEALLTQQIYQILAGYPDGNDAQVLRDDPLFQILADVSPNAEQPLASGSTLTRFQYAYTRRQHELPEEDRPAYRDMYTARTERLEILNDFLLDWFVRTRPTPPTHVVIDLDGTDDPVHGRQALSGYHGYYRQHQYFPVLAFEGSTGFPLAAWLRPGRAGANWGLVETLDRIVRRLRAAWPDVLMVVRGDNGGAGPDLYEYCERQGLLYAFGYSSNAVLQRRTDTSLSNLEVYYHFYGHREPWLQAFDVFEDYQAGDWSRPRRIVAKLEINPNGSQRRFVVTNLSGHPRGIYRGFYVQRGAVPEQPIDELKNGLQADRLSASSFRANGFRLLLHVVAYALVVLFREATAAIPEVATATVSTLRQRWWKVGAVVVTSARRIWLHVSETWPGRRVWAQIHEAVRVFVEQRSRGQQSVSPAAAELLM